VLYQGFIVASDQACARSAGVVTCTQLEEALPTVGSLRVPSPNFAGVLSTASLTKDSHTKCKCRAARLPGFKLALLSTASQPYQKTTFISFTQLKRTIRWLLPSLVLFYSLLHTRSRLHPSPSSFFTPKTNTIALVVSTQPQHISLFQSHRYVNFPFN
jgi:hypothetical protein